MSSVPRARRRSLVTVAAVTVLCAAQVAVIADHWSSTPANPGIPVAVTVHDRPCGNTGLDRCLALVVPADHRHPEALGTAEVTFGIHEAAVAAEGTLVIAVGGPGASGLDAAQGYIDYLPASIVHRFDLVFFDARGVGRSGRLACPKAEVEEPDWAQRAAELGAGATLEGASVAWSVDCLTEAGMTGNDVPTYSTRQVVDDLEAFRHHEAIESLVIYGESYGSLVAQLYAHRYPAHTARVVIDGPVDPTLDGFAFAVESKHGFDAALDLTLAGCADDPVCKADYAGPPEAAWSNLVGRFDAGVLEIDATPDQGAAEMRTLTLGQLNQVAIGSLYTPTERMLLQRALAAASHEDYGLLTDILHAYSASTPEAFADDSAAAFLVIRCADYGRSAAAPISEIEAAVAAATAADEILARDLWYELPCFAGFEAADAAPNPLVDPSAQPAEVPTLVLTATADPVTPVQMARRIATRLPNAHLVETDGGPHVTFPGLGECPDDIVVAFILDGALPDDARTICHGFVADPYVPVLRAGLDAYDDVGDGLRALEEDLYASPAYLLWSGNGLRVPCRHGGTMTLRSGSDADVFGFSRCQLFPDWPMDGSAHIKYDGTTTMDLTAPDTELAYRSDVEWAVTVSGTFDGEPIQIGP